MRLCGRLGLAALMFAMSAGANMPSYYAEYQFERGKLMRFRFGYNYP